MQRLLRTPLVDSLLSVLIPIVMLGMEMYQGGWVLEDVCSERRGAGRALNIR